MPPARGARREDISNQHIQACPWSIGSAVLRWRESPGLGDACSPAWRQRWQWPARERCQTDPAEWRSCVSTEQRENLEAILRQSAFPVDIDLNEQRRRCPPCATSRHRRRRGHPRHHPWGAARLPNLLSDPRRSGRCTGQSRTAPVGASRRRGTRHRIATGGSQGMTDSRTIRGRLRGSNSSEPTIQ